MLFLLLLTALSLVFSLLLTPVCRAVALHFNLVDVPDTKRKMHRKPIPRIGGVAVAMAAVGACVMVALVSRWSHLTAPGFTALNTVAPATLMVFFIGLTDDLFNLKAWTKLAGQILAASVAVSEGVHIRWVAGMELPFWIGAVVTVGWLVVCANAVNLIDGLDGLAAGIALVACTTMIVAALLAGHMDLALAIAPMAGALLGFLVYNSNPASIFLGDCGSLVLGFLLGCYGVLWSEKSAAIVGMTAPLIAFAIPLIDTTVAIARRFLRGKPIFAADRAHIHHRLLAQGMTPQRAVLMLYAAAGVAGILALMVGQVSHPLQGVVIVLFACGMIAGVRKLKYVEFSTLRKLLQEDFFRKTLNARLAVQNLEEGLATAVTPHECWAAISEASEDFGFQQIEMNYGGYAFRRRNTLESIRWWEIRISISDQEWVELTHEFGSGGHSTAVAAFAETIIKVLGPRCKTPVRSQVASISFGVSHPPVR